MENQEAEITLKSPRKPFPGWLYGILFVVFDAIGVGVLMRGTDANGAALAFTAYIPLTDK